MTLARSIHLKLLIWGASTTPLAIEELADGLPLNNDSIMAQLIALHYSGIIEFIPEKDSVILTIKGKSVNP